LNRYKLTYKPLGSIAALIQWPKEIDKDILKNISLFRSKIQESMGEYVLETVPAYNSLTISLNFCFHFFSIYGRFQYVTMMSSDWTLDYWQRQKK